MWIIHLCKCSRPGGMESWATQSRLKYPDPQLGIWNQMILKIVFDPSHSVIPWFYDTQRATLKNTHLILSLSSLVLVSFSVWVQEVRYKRRKRVIPWPLHRLLSTQQLSSVAHSVAPQGWQVHLLVSTNKLTRAQVTQALKDVKWLQWFCSYRTCGKFSFKETHNGKIPMNLPEITSSTFLIQRQFLWPLNLCYEDVKLFQKDFHLENVQTTPPPNYTESIFSSSLFRRNGRTITVIFQIQPELLIL